MNRKLKDTLAMIGECVSFLALVYIGYYMYCVLCISDGVPSGELYHWLGMDCVTAGIKSAIGWVWNITH